MAHCININSLEYKSLLENTGLNPVILKAKISVYQEKNGLDKWPSLSELIGTKPIIQNEIQYQIPSGRETEEYIATEKTIRDLAARMSDRIGILVRFESDRTKEYKGKLENGTAVINLAYATLDTVPHEVLSHPIIRALKLKSEKTIESEIDKMIEMGIIKKEC